ncbi:centrosomal protein of 44 kDa [Echeneis naucrates]|uniref:Centrosomal protein of 44 kDa n=1 Tax=Echeneis naucrates TaxID=173247 RepID=A0A665W0Z3_ECHNA|nr:centrosomal protein of 44 kDa [Echeneis naucrates]
MLSTGDVQGCLRRLESLLRIIKFPGYVDYNGLSKGDPSAFLPIVSFTLTSFSPPFTEQLMKAGLELTGKTDLRFTDTMYKALRDIFHYQPILSKQQFLQWGFSQRKISVTCDIINLVLQKHNQLKKNHQRKVGTRSLIQEKDLSGTGTTTQATGQICREPVELGFQSSVRSPTSGNDGREETHLRLTAASDPDNTTSEVEGRLSALEAKIESLLSGQNRLRILEEHLEELERWRNSGKTEEVIKISRGSWENLMNRVLLLETKLELNNAQLSAPPPLSITACSSNSTSYASKLRLEQKAYLPVTVDK